MKKKFSESSMNLNANWININYKHLHVYLTMLTYIHMYKPHICMYVHLINLFQLSNSLYFLILN